MGIKMYAFRGKLRPMSDTVAIPSSAPNPWSSHRGPLVVDDDFVILDDPMEQDVFTQEVDEDGPPLRESILMVQGMHCAACADTVEEALDGRPGVVWARVHAATRRLTLRWDPAQTALSELARIVGRTGYRLLPMQQALSLSERQAETRMALWRLFVAGFCMMQVMMYAWPEYVTDPGEIPADLEKLLRWASWVLCLPVVFFSSTPFFKNAWRDFKTRRVGMDTPVTLGILVTFIGSSGATFDPTGPWGHEVWYESLTMFVFFLLGGRYLEFKARDRTAGALDALMNRLPEQCERQRPDGSFEVVSLKRLALGDVVRVQAGQALPGDGVVLSERIMLDEALLTGESRPVHRVRGEPVVAGSFNLSGTALLRIDKLGRDTRFAQIVGLMERASTEKPRLAQLADRIAAPFMWVVLLAAAAAAYYWWTVEPSKALAVAIAILIVTCPCALSLATPSAMLSSAGALAVRGILVRRLQAFEALSRVDTFVFDKTGTLTQDRAQLRELRLAQGWGRQQVLHHAARLSSASLHPVSRAITQAAQAEQVDYHVSAAADVQDVSGAGLVCTDASGVRWRLGSATHCGLGPEHPAAWDDAGADAPRAYLVNEQGWVATFVMSEGLREDAQEAIAALKQIGMRVWILSGDREQAVARVAQQLGVSDVVAQATPEHKLSHLHGLQQQGARLAMVGDGLNDGPVLARADVSFALGHGAPLTQSQSDFVVQSGRLSEVAQTVLVARKTMTIVRQNLFWAALYNAACVPLAVVGLMPPWLAALGMALSSFLVIGNATRLSAPKTSVTPVLAR